MQPQPACTFVPSAAASGGCLRATPTLAILPGVVSLPPCTLVVHHDLALLLNRWDLKRGIGPLLPRRQAGRVPKAGPVCWAPSICNLLRMRVHRPAAWLCKMERFATSPSMQQVQAAGAFCHPASSCPQIGQCTVPSWGLLQVRRNQNCGWRHGKLACNVVSRANNAVVQLHEAGGSESCNAACAVQAGQSAAGAGRRVAQ